jgi:superfamily II DNA or RNA helicase
MELRDYQTEAIDAITSAWDRGVTAPAVVLPTGSGKTVIFSALTGRLHREHKRVLVIAHRDELIDQTVRKLADSGIPLHHLGVVKANRDDVTMPCIVASAQTLVHPLRRIRLGRIDAIITDECHHYASDKYSEVLSHWDCNRVGFTATMSRADKRDLNGVWDEIVYSKNISWMISEGHLVRPIGRMINVADLEIPETNRADYTDRAISKAMRESHAVETTVRVWQDEANRKSTILFAPSVEMTEAFASGFNNAGITAATITGSTPKTERKKIYKDFADGKITILCSCMVLTEGFDSPRAEVAVIARPTKSESLYVQMVGRVLRPYPGKTSALVLDMAGASQGKTLNLAAVIPEPCKTVEGVEIVRGEPGTGTGDGVDPVDLGQAGMTGVDIMSGRAIAWQKTNKGINFVATKNNFLFIFPNGDGTFSAGATFSQQSIWGPNGELPERFCESVNLETAIIRIEDKILSTDSRFLAETSRPWRRKTPSDKQIAFAHRIGITSARTMTSGTLTDAINRVKASAVLDVLF